MILSAALPTMLPVLIPAVITPIIPPDLQEPDGLLPMCRQLVMYPEQLIILRFTIILKVTNMALRQAAKQRQDNSREH